MSKGDIFMYDCVILGSGPAGLTAAIYAQRAKLNSIIIEKIYMGAGQITDSERVDNYPGLYGENGFSLGKKFREHAEELGANFHRAEVIGIKPVNDGYYIDFSDGSAIDTKTIIYALGAERRKLNVNGEAEFTGKGVSYCAVCDGAFYRGKTVAVAGGGDTALGDAVLLSKFAEKVFIIHRRDQFRANRDLQDKVKALGNVNTIFNARITEIIGEEKVNSIKIEKNDSTQILPVNGVFVAVGSVPNSQLLNGIVELDERGYVVAGEDGKTSAKGIFVAGDVRAKAFRQVVTAASDGANCVYSVEEYLENNV